MGYTKDTFTGLRWMGGFRLVTRLFSFARIAILARLLTPIQFGVFGVATLVLHLLETFTQTGVSVYLMQEKDKLKKYINSAYVLSIVRGIIIFFLIFFSSHAVSSYFNSPESENLLKLVSFVALIRGFINPARIKFLKHLEYSKEFWISFSVFITDYIVSVGIAFLLKSPIALVWGLIAGAVVEAYASHRFIPLKPKFNYKKKEIKEMLSRGKWVTGSTILSYIFSEGDDIFVGKLINTQALGTYQAAYKISTLPITEIVRVFNRVTFPIYTNIREDTKRLQKAFLKTTATISLLIVPIGLILYFYAYEVVYFMLGVDWLAVVPVLKILSIFGVVQGIVESTNPLFNSIKKQELTTRITLVAVVVMIFTIAPLIEKFGVVGAGYSVLISSVLSLPLVYYYLKKTIQI
jgi:O-antigen/teichoic acid export membrane protein